MIRSALALACALMVLAAPAAGARAAVDAPASDLPWPRSEPVVPLTYVLVTDDAGGHHAEATVALGAAEPVDVTGDGNADVVVRVDPAGATGFRVGVTRLGDAPVAARVAVLASSTTHPLVPDGERVLLGFDARAVGMPAAFALDAALVPPAGVSLTQRVDAAPGALTLLAARVAPDARAEAALALDPVPPRFGITLTSVAGETRVALVTADTAWPAGLPDPAARAQDAKAGVDVARALATASAATVIDHAIAPAPWLPAYWNDAWRPWLEARTPVENLPRVPGSGAEAGVLTAPADPALGGATRVLLAVGNAPETLVRVGTDRARDTGGPAAEERAFVRDAVREDLVARPRLDATLGTVDATTSFIVDALPERLDVTSREGVVQWRASDAVDRLTLRFTTPERVTAARVDGMPREVDLAWTTDGDVAWSTDARVPLVTVDVTHADGARVSARLEDVPPLLTVTRDAATGALTLDAPARLGRLEGLMTHGPALDAPAHGVHARVTDAGRVVAVGLTDVTLASFTPATDGGSVRLVSTRVQDLTARVENGADVVDARVTSAPRDLTLAFEREGRVSVARIIADASVPAVHVDVTRDGAHLTAALTGLPREVTVRADASTGAFSWHGTGRTSRIALGVHDAGASFAHVDAELVDVPADLTLTVDAGDGVALSAPGAIGRLTVSAWTGAPVPVPANGAHYRDYGSSRAVAVSLPGVRVVDVDLRADATSVRLATAGDYVFTALAERLGERVHVRVDRMPADVTLTHADTGSGTRTTWNANARVGLLRVDLARGGEYVTVEYANVPRAMALEQGGSSGNTNLAYSASETGGRLEVWTNEGNRDSLWFRLKDPVPTSLRLSTAGDTYRFDTSEHVTVDLFDDRGRADDYLLVQNVRVRKMHVGFDGGSTGWVKLDTDNHDMKGRVKNENGGSGFELNVRGHLRAQNFELKWWNYIPYSTSGSLSVSDTTLRIKSGGSWHSISL